MHISQCIHSISQTEGTSSWCHVVFPAGLQTVAQYLHYCSKYYLFKKKKKTVVFFILYYLFSNFWLTLKNSFFVRSPGKDHKLNLNHKEQIHDDNLITDTYDTHMTLSLRYAIGTFTCWVELSLLGQKSIEFQSSSYSVSSALCTTSNANPRVST